MATPMVIGDMIVAGISLLIVKLSASNADLQLSTLLDNPLTKKPVAITLPLWYNIVYQVRRYMKVGDMIKLPRGCRNHWELPTGVALLIAKLPRNDRLEYDWKVLVDGRYINLGRQIENDPEVLSASR